MPLHKNTKCHKHVLFFLVFTLITSSINGQCDQDYDWAVWDNFSGTSATGTITQDTHTIAMEITANYEFSATSSIFNFSAFNGFDSDVPNATVPRTTWSVGSGGETTMCFSEVVTNPVLLLSSLGSPGTPVTLELSLPYTPIYDGGGMMFVNDTTIIGEEGYTVLLFPGDFQCITIFSSTPEIYTNLTWGLNPPLFSVDITGDLISCDSTNLLASGGSFYSWSGGITPNQPNNIFTSSGDYFLTVTDDNGCTVTTSVAVTVDPDLCDCNGVLYGTAVIDECGECLEPTDPNFNQSCVDCNGVPNGTAVIDECGECLDPTDSAFNQSCAGKNKVYIPNAFSPNDDGVNDRFQISKNPEVDAQIIEYLIFNRWGDLIYEVKNLEFGFGIPWWDGKFKGEKATPGVYIYSIEIKFQNGAIAKYKGDITLTK